MVLGVTVVENTAVSKIWTEKDRVSMVETRGGQRVSCDYFVNCSGFWAREVGQMCSPVVRFFIIIREVG